MRHELFISLRYLMARRKQTFISIITMISVGGVALGVAALIVVISVMTGFKEELQEKILGIYSHLVVTKMYEFDNDLIEPIGYREAMAEIENIPGVEATTPYINAQVMLATDYTASGAIVRGIDTATSSKVITLGKIEGNIESLNDATLANPGVIIGAELAKRIGVFIGSTITVLSPRGALSPLGLSPKMQVFEVVGIFDSGVYDFDSTFAFISLASAQSFFEFGDNVTGIEVRVKNIYKAREVRDIIQSRLGYAYYAQDWMEMNRNLFAALQLEKVAMFIILIMIVFVAAFNIISTLIMVVMEKNKDIAILKSMGSSKRSIMKIFMFQGLVIGVVGTFIGSASGFIICGLLKKFQFIKIDPSVYPFSTLPVKMVWSDITIICISSLILCFFATLYPAWQAARLDPAEALRYE